MTVVPEFYRKKVNRVSWITGEYDKILVSKEDITFHNDDRCNPQGIYLTHEDFEKFLLEYQGMKDLIGTHEKDLDNDISS